MKLKDKMVAFSKKPAAVAEVEGWNTRFGHSVRVVKRTEGGQFISNVSAKQLAKPL